MNSEIKRALRDILRGEVVSFTSSAYQKMIRLDLMDSSGSLTKNGWKQAIVTLPLIEQCNNLGIGYEEIIGLDFKKNPELAAWRHLSSSGYVGGYCEGGPILILIRAAALNVLTDMNTFGSREDACNRATEAQLTILHDHFELILSEIRSTDSQKVVRNFSEIYNSLIVQECYPGLTHSAISSLFDMLGADRLAQITSAIMEDPYLYRAGWPDLTLTDGNEMLWAEVKTTDRLHMSQITTIHRMRPLLPGTIRVVKLIA